jgi:excinuclease ABC subunit C
MIDSQFLKTVPDVAGVYQMLDERGVILYIGKAKNLKKRLSSYFRKNLAPKTASLMGHAVDINLVVTTSETQALILESELIKTKKPRYNILLRDDKSYPYIYISTKHDFPRLDLYRGLRKKTGRYFGPYPSGSAARETTHLLQKIFLIRSCSDSFFSHRSRPCLQYQIKRCSGPCAEGIGEASYRKDIEHAVAFLEGKSDKIIKLLTERMREAAKKKSYEAAAKYRDQIFHLRKIQEKQYIVNRTAKNIDIVACVQKAGRACLQLLVVRDGRMLGNKVFFPHIPAGTETHEIFHAFLAQHYLLGVASDVPQAIVTNVSKPVDLALLAEIEQRANHKVKIYKRVQGERAVWVKMAESSAEQALQRQLLSKQHVANQLIHLQKALNIDRPITRIECFDVSHHSGEATVASCVAFGLDGALKNDYRRFNIQGVKANDDFAAMHQALVRRYTAVKKNKGKLPDILLVDGGKGQLTQAKLVMKSLQINEVILLGIAKGRTRKPGFETLFLASQKTPIFLAPDSCALHLLQQIRDEAHRFAITHHRQKKQKRQRGSVLDTIPGVGPRRRKNLLEHFGGLQGLRQASAKAISQVPGISESLAETIADFLR